MILGVGTDLCAVDRIERALESPRFAERTLTPRERERLERLCPERRAEFAAGRFAAKEAVAKALGTGFSGFGFREIEVMPDALGRPTVCLSGGAQARLSELSDCARAHVSISHDGGLALAFAVIESIEEVRP